MKWAKDGRENDFEPIFIVGHPRSGTTLVANILGRNAAIAATPESHFATAIVDRLDRWANEGPERLVAKLLQSTNLRDFDLTPERVLARLAAREVVSPAYLLRCCLEEYAGQRGKPRVAEKTPVHIRRLPLLAHWYPRAKFVWVVRDARDSILSLKQVSWASSNDWRLGLEWARNASLALSFERRCPHAIHRLYFEQMLTDPVSELARVHRFLAVKFDEQQLMAQDKAAVIPKWEEGWKWRARGDLDARRASAWKQNGSRETICRLNAMLGTYLRQLGYGETELANCPMTTRLVGGMLGRALPALFNERLYFALEPMYRMVEKVWRRA